MILVTSGCSFSDSNYTKLGSWPTYLQQHLGCDARNVGLGSQGNGLISRKLIYHVSELLKTTDPDDILVGVMWSGPSRYDFYTTDYENFMGPGNNNSPGWTERPTEVVPDSPGRWVITTSNMMHKNAKHYYKTSYDHVGSLIYTCEHVLRVQWFLKLHNIKYFMTTYTGEVFPPEEHVDTRHLIDQIDFGQFLPVVGEYEWCRDFSGLDFPIIGDFHPSSEQHDAFAEQVILPFLKQKQYIND